MINNKSNVYRSPSSFPSFMLRTLRDLSPNFRQSASSIQRMPVQTDNQEGTSVSLHLCTAYKTQSTLGYMLSHVVFSRMPKIDVESFPSGNTVKHYSRWLLAASDTKQSVSAPSFKARQLDVS